MPYKVTISRGGNVLGSSTKPTRDEAKSLFDRWYAQSIARITELMDDQGYVQEEYRAINSYALKPTYYTTCKIPEAERTQREEYVISFVEVSI